MAEQMDAIIILGALIGRDGYPGRVGRFRLQHALPLVIETYPDSWVMITGGVSAGAAGFRSQGHGRLGGQQALEQWGEARSRDLEQRLLPEELSLNTAESAHYTALLMQARGLKTAGLITDTLHMPRVEYLFKRTFAPRQLEFRPLPARGSCRITGSGGGICG